VHSPGWGGARSMTLTKVIRERAGCEYLAGSPLLHNQCLDTLSAPEPTPKRVVYRLGRAQQCDDLLVTGGELTSEFLSDLNYG